MVALAAVAVPLVGAGAAQAALAGANPLTTTNRPDLRTVTLTGSSTAKFCFDQVVAQVPSQSAFSIGGYRSDNFLTSTNPTAIDPTNNKCVNATFPVSIGDTGDLPQFTFGQVGEGAVLAQVGSGFVGNRADSTTLSGSNTHNGTAGHTTAPDLTGVVVDNVNTGNTLDFIYDQQVQISSVDSTKFHAYYQDGTEAPAPTGVVAGGNVVKVTFGGPLSDPTHGPAVQAANESFAVRSQTADHTRSTVDSMAIGGTAGATTTLPDLIATTLSTDGTFIDYTFDKPLDTFDNTGTVRAKFKAWGSTGQFLEPSCISSQNDSVGPCSSTPQLANNQVRAFFTPALFGPDSNTVHEYGVKASVDPGAVEALTEPLGNEEFNVWQEMPIGDNQNAFGAGFTSGPDAFRVTFDTATNTAVVTFDQRVFDSEPSSFVLLDANGTPLPGGVGVASGPPATGTTTPGTYQITVSFTGASVADAKALEIKGPLPGTAFDPAVSTNLPCTTTLCEEDNVQQIVSPTGAAAVLKPGAKVRWVRVAVKKHVKHQTKKHHKH